MPIIKAPKVVNIVGKIISVALVDHNDAKIAITEIGGKREKDRKMNRLSISME